MKLAIFDKAASAVCCMARAKHAWFHIFQYREHI